MKQVYSKDITDQEYLITLDSELHTKNWFNLRIKKGTSWKQLPASTKFS